jgi:hypothetical protein
MDRLVQARESKRTPLFVLTPGDQPPPYDGPLSALVVSNLLRLLLDGGTPRPAEWEAWMAALPPAPARHAVSD